MGLFDHVRCRYKLPWGALQDATWQSKDTPAQYLERYEIRQDGTLWHQCDNQWEQESGFEGELQIYHLTFEDREPSCSVRFWFRAGRIRDAIFRTSPLHPSGGSVTSSGRATHQPVAPS